MIDLVEILKIVGSLSGLFATAFLLWDRYSKHFPVAIIVAQPIIPGSVNISHRLYLKNVSDRPILISWEHGGMNQLRVAKDRSTHGILRSQRKGKTIVSLDAGTEVFLPILKPSNYNEIDPDNSLQIALRWRFAQPRVSKPDRVIPVWIKKRDFDNIVDAYMSSSAPDD